MNNAVSSDTSDRLNLPSDDSAVPGHVHALSAPENKSNENKSNWKSTASATAKLFLRGVGESSDAFPPLKTVALALCFILGHCEVRPHSVHSIHNAYSHPSEQRRILKR